RGQERRLHRPQRQPARRHPQHADDRERVSCRPQARSRGAARRVAESGDFTVRSNTQLAIAAGIAVLTVSPGVAQSGRVHDLKLLPENVHWGYYDAAVKPALRIASGDSVRVEAMLARGLPRLFAAGVKDDEIPETLKVVERTVTERGPGAHPLAGPIYVEGAASGDALEVKIVAFEFL